MSKDINSLNKLNKEQKEAVEFGKGPVLIVAGAGTGKTTVITSRILRLIETKKAKPEEILALTFTDKAAEEMEERVDKLLPFGYVELWISTFHSFCERILKQHGLDIGISTDFRVLDQTASWVLVRQNFAKFDLDYYRPLSNPSKFIRVLIEHFSRCKDEGIYPKEYLKRSDALRLNLDEGAFGSKAIKSKHKKGLAQYQQEADRIKEIANAYSMFQKLLLDNNSLDFGDLINYTLKLFKERPKILEKYQGQFKYILVDEFQDTNWSQYELVKFLARPKNNLTVCADDDQCLPGESEIEIFRKGKITKRKIKYIKKTDNILTAVGKGHIGVSKVNKVFKRKKQAKLLTIRTRKGYKLTVTDNHKMFCLVPRTPKGKYHYAYLMYRRDVGWRIGITDDLVWRLQIERSADKILAIKAFNTDAEARYYETLWSLKYGIPTSCFQTRDGIIIKENLLKSLYKKIDVGAGVRRLAQDLNIDLNAPHFCLDAVNRGQKVRIVINLQMCYRKYRSKEHVRKGKTLILNPWIRHRIYLETSNRSTIQKLKAAGFKLGKAKKGMRFCLESDDLKKLGSCAEKLQKLTGGFIESKFNIGVKFNKPMGNRRSSMALVMPAKNLALGHYLPVRTGNEIIYDQIINIKEENKQITVYDLEIDKTHNFIADGIVVHNSIYQWRGASFNNVLQFRKDYPKAKEIVLTDNYRSSQNILDMAHQFIQFNNPNRLEYQINQVVEIAKEAKEKGMDLRGFKKINKKLKATKKNKGVIGYLHYKTSSEELFGVINKIKEILKKDEKARLNDFAVLTRTNETANVFARAMERAGIPCQFLACRGLYTKPIILDIIAFFKLLTNYYENSAVYRILNLPCLNIPFEDLSKITQRSSQQGQSIYETLQQLSLIPGLSGKTATEITFMLGLIQKQMARIKDHGLSEIFVDFLKNSGYLDYLATKENETISKENLRLINLFYDKIKDFEEREIDPCLTNFVEQLDMELESGDQGSLKFDPESGPETIKIMTIHSAKGLEFKYVFLVGLVDKRFPTIERKNLIEIPQSLVKEVMPKGDIHLQEERRLFYVGMTRAKNGLFFTLADNYGGMRKKKPSRFLQECGLAEKGKMAETCSRPAGAFDKHRVFVKSQTNYKLQTTNYKQYTLPDHFSHTQLVAFEKCPLQYKFAHILKIPMKGRPNFSFGKTVHNTLFQFVNLFLKQAKTGQGNLFGSARTKSEKIPIDFKELLKIYEQKWIDEWYENKKQKQEYYKLGRKILKSFYDDFLKTRPKIEFIQGEPALEQGFNLKIGGNALIGRIDRIDKLQDNSSEIIDYKTGAVKQSLSAQNKQQLLIYQIAAEDILGLKPSKLTYYYLEQRKRISFCGTKEDKERLRQKILEEIQEIKKSNFYPRPGWHCQYCDFKEICEYRKNA